MIYHVLAERMPADEAVGSFLVAIACGVTLGLAILFLIYKMVDGDLKPAPGISAIILILLAMTLAIHPPHPAVPGVVLVMALALMCFFPFAEGVLERIEMQGVEASQMARSYEAIRVRPDNIAAKFELARQLHDHGFVAQAIQLAGSSLAGLGSERDEVKNQSMRDLFYREEMRMKRWQAEPMTPHQYPCPSCGAVNGAEKIFCTGCGRPYLLDLVASRDSKPKVWGKLVLAWAAIALFIPAGVGIGMSTAGLLQVLSFAAALGCVGALLAWLFKPPNPAKASA